DQGWVLASGERRRHRNGHADLAGEVRRQTDVDRELCPVAGPQGPQVAVPVTRDRLVVDRGVRRGASRREDGERSRPGSTRKTVDPVAAAGWDVAEQQAAERVGRLDRDLLPAPVDE